MTTDIFDATILCKACKNEMLPIVIQKEGAQLRAVQCNNCQDYIIHPSDMNCWQSFNSNLKGKTYNVKLRLVGNSHAISIPKEIVTFMREQERFMDDMVKLCFEDMHKLSVRFGSVIPLREDFENA